MNSIWNKNISLFSDRFPELSETFSSCFEKIEKEGIHITDTSPHESIESVFPFWHLATAKSGAPTAEENGRQLHSAYDPKREAEKIAVSAKNNIESQIFVFYAFGLGYLPNAFARQFPESTIIIVEPDILHLFASFTLIDWTPVLKCIHCIFAVQCPEETVLSIIKQTGTSIGSCNFYSNKAQTAHAAPYFESLSELVERNRQAEAINTNTLERFSGLWLRNSCRNLPMIRMTDGVAIYKNAVEIAGDLPFCILAAGPTLADTLPYIAEIKKRTILICVDTALHACLNTGVEPDFIIIMDPQYYAARHIIGLTSPSSVVITESAVYPSVTRFTCRKKVLCSSLFPLGQYFEKYTGSKGILGAGGSVSTTAWDFARLCGAKEIFMAGLDLGFPDGKTHIKGSTAEETFHQISFRLHPSETYGTGTLYALDTQTGFDYDRNKIQTDSRMQLFAWWFESRLITFPEQRTYTLSRKSLAIPGVLPAKISDILDRTEAEDRKNDFFRKTESGSSENTRSIKSFDDAYTALVYSLIELRKLSSEGLALCTKALDNSKTNYSILFTKLSAIDRSILTSSSKDIVSLVFPTDRQMKAIYTSEHIPRDDPQRSSVFHSFILYRELRKAVDTYIWNLKSAERK